MNRSRTTCQEQGPPARRWGLCAGAVLVALGAGGGMAWSDEPEADPAVSVESRTGAGPAEARAFYEEGLRRFAARDFVAAIAAFEKSFAIDALPEVMFAWAQALRLSGDCPGAQALFENFLATAPPAQQVEAANLAMRRCAEEPPRVSPASASDAGVTPARGPLQTGTRASIDTAGGIGQRVPQTPTRSVLADWPAGLAAGAGAVLAAVGAALLVSAGDRAAEANRQGSYDGVRSGFDTAHLRLNFGIGALVAGGALISAGVIRYVWLVSRGDETSVAVGGKF